jgi:hypothetical protein
LAGIDRLRRRRGFAHAERAHAARRALDGMGDLAPALGVAQASSTALSWPTMSVTWPSNSRRISAFKRSFAAGVAGEMVQIDGLGTRGLFRLWRQTGILSLITAKAALMLGAAFP